MLLLFILSYGFQSFAHAETLSQVSYQLQHECTAGHFYGTQYDETQTRTIQDCANLCHEDTTCQFFAYGNEDGFQSTTGYTSDGYRANDCIFVSSGEFRTGWESTCRWNIYGLRYAINYKIVNSGFPGECSNWESAIISSHTDTMVAECKAICNLEPECNLFRVMQDGNACQTLRSCDYDYTKGSWIMYEAVSNVDVRLYKENWKCEFLRGVVGPTTPEACAEAVLADSTCSHDHFTWSDSSLVHAPCKCVNDCASTGVYAHVYDTYSITTEVDCDVCLARFMKADGCACAADDSCDESILVPKGCYSCGAQAAMACGHIDEIDCDVCVAEFMEEDGCACWADESCDEANLIPEGCDYCGVQAASSCENILGEVAECCTSISVSSLPNGIASNRGGIFVQLEDISRDGYPVYQNIDGFYMSFIAEYFVWVIGSSYTSEYADIVSMRHNNFIGCPNHMPVWLFFFDDTWHHTDRISAVCVECQDYHAVVAQWGGIDYTCSLIAEHAIRKDCDTQMSTLVEEFGATLGDGISADMFIKDICPLVYQKYCTTCATSLQCGVTQGGHGIIEANFSPTGESGRRVANDYQCSKICEFDASCKGWITDTPVAEDDGNVQCWMTSGPMTLKTDSSRNAGVPCRHGGEADQAYCNGLSQSQKGCVGGCAWNRHLHSCEPFRRSTQRMVFASDFQVGQHITNDEDLDCWYSPNVYFFQTKEFCEGPDHRRARDRMREYGKRLVQMATFTNTAEQSQHSHSMQRADGIFMNGDMTVWGHKKEYEIMYTDIMMEAAKFGMPYFPGLGNHDFGVGVETASAFGADPDSGVEPLLGRRNLGNRNFFQNLFLNENTSNERSYAFIQRFIETFCTGGSMYNMWHAENIQFAPNKCDEDTYLYSHDNHDVDGANSLGYSVFNKGVLYFQLHRNPSSPGFAMKEHYGFYEKVRFTKAGTGRWFLEELKKVENDENVHAIVLNWHFGSCYEGQIGADDMCNSSFQERIFREIERHNAHYPSQRVIAIFTGHTHNRFGDHSARRWYNGIPLEDLTRNQFYTSPNGAPIFLSGSSFSSSALDIDIDLESRTFTINAWGREELDSPLIRHCMSDSSITSLCTVYHFDGHRTQISVHDPEAPYMTNPNQEWRRSGGVNEDEEKTKGPASCGNSFVHDTGLNCWDEVHHGALVEHAHCEGPTCTRADVQRCCQSTSVTCLRKNECCFGTQCFGCPSNGAHEWVWFDTCYSLLKCNKDGRCNKRPGQCCVWGSDCHGCPWGSEWTYPSDCASSRKCKSAP